MQQMLTKTAVIQAISDEREWWNSMVAETGPDRMDSIGISDDWTLRNLIAHLLS